MVGQDAASMSSTRHVRSDRLERQLQDAQDQLAEAHARINEYLTERDAFQAAAAQARDRHAEERQTLQTRLRAAESKVMQLKQQFWHRTEQCKVLSERCDEMGEANQDLRAYLHSGKRVFRRAMAELDRNWYVSQDNQTICLANRGIVYHLDAKCYRFHNSQVQHIAPCDYCAVRELTPHIGPEGGTTLAEDIESWVADVDKLVGGD